MPPPEPPSSTSGGSAVFVGNLQWWTTDAELEAACGEYGPVVSVQACALPHVVCLAFLNLYTAHGDLILVI